MKLSEAEQSFVACFVEDGYTLFKPKYKNFISLYSYLDSTNETLKQQKEQIERDDPYFVALLQAIQKSSWSTKTKEKKVKSVYEELSAGGFFENPNFKERFDLVVKWLLSNSSRYHLDEARRAKRAHFENKRNKARLMRDQVEKERVHQVYISNKKEIDENYAQVMIKLSKNQFNTSSKELTQNRSVTDDWGRQKATKVDDVGWWREQE